MTYREQFELAMRCTNREEAARFVDSEIVRYESEYHMSSEESLTTILANLGYMAGYYDDATARKVHELFGAVHPIFGTADYHTTVSPEQAFRLGFEKGKG